MRARGRWIYRRVPLKRNLCSKGFARSTLVAESGEQRCDGNILVQSLPMQTATCDPDLLALFGGAVQQSRKPSQRHTDHPAIAQIDPEAVGIEADTHWTRRNAHSRPSQSGYYSPQPSSATRAKSVHRILRCRPHARLASARISPPHHFFQRECEAAHAAILHWNKRRT